MTAATEEYFLETRRLQGLLEKFHQQNALGSPMGVSDREEGVARKEYTPNGMDIARRSSWDVEDSVLIHGPEARDHSVSASSPVHTRQEARRHHKAKKSNENSGGDEAYRNRRDQIGASAAGRRKNRDLLVDEAGMPVAHRRPTSRERRVSPPRRAQMVARAGQETFGCGGHEQTQQQVARGGLSHRRRRGSRSQASIGAAAAKARARGFDAHKAAAGPDGRRPQSAPRRQRDVQLKSMGSSRRADSMSSFERGRRQSGRGHAARSGSRGESVASAGNQSTTRMYSSLRRAHIPTVPVPEEPPSCGKGDRGNLRLNSSPGLASPRSGSSREEENAGGVSRIPGRTALHHVIGEGGDDNCGDDVIGADGSVEISSERVGGYSKPLPASNSGSSDDDDVKHRASNASWKSLASPAEPAAPAEGIADESVPVEENGNVDATATAEAKKRPNEQTTNQGSTRDTPGSGDANSVITNDGERKAADGDELVRKLITGADASCSWAVLDAKEAHGSEEGIVRAVQASLTNNDADADFLKTPHVDIVACEKSMAEDFAKSDPEEHESAAGEIDGMPPETPRNNSNDSQSNCGNDRASPRAEGGGNSSAIQSEASHGAIEEVLQDERGVVEEEKIDEPLFVVESDADHDDPPKGEIEATPSEYGDDFDDDFDDDFEDEEY